MSSQVVGLPRPRPLRHCLLRRCFLLTLLQSFLICVLILPAFPTVDAKPISIWYLIAELSVTVNMATVEIAAVTDEQNVLVVSKSTLVASVVVILRIQHKLLLLNRHPLCLAYVCVSRRAGELEDGGEGASAAWANGWRFAPFRDACEAELVQAFKTASDGVVFVEANGTHILVGAALFVLYLCGLLEMLLQWLRGHFHSNRCMLTRLLNGPRQQHPPLLVNHWVIFLLLLRRLHSLLVPELLGGRRRHDFAGWVDAGLIKRAIRVFLSVFIVTAGHDNLK